MSSGIVEVAISRLISAALGSLIDWRHTPEAGRFDFIVETKDHKKIAIEAISQHTLRNRRRVNFIKNQLEEIGPVDRLLIVSAEPLTEKELGRAKQLFSGASVPVDILSLNDLPMALGLESPGDLLSARTLLDLQLEGFQKNLKSYREKHDIGPEPKGLAFVTSEKDAVRVTENKDITLAALSRQFSYETIAELSKLSEESMALEEALKLGNQVKDVTVVLSDIVNFSSIVKEARPEDLRAVMSKYYAEARELVWKHNGVLDKFIGDAVLAVFGYPFSGPDAALKAALFAEQLIEIGSNIVGELTDSMNVLITTGTRVGIATDDIYPLNIGEESLEVSFVGDVINLAARLEKHSEHDGVLISRKTEIEIENYDSDFFLSRVIQKRILDSSDMKGQGYDVPALQILCAKN